MKPILAVSWIKFTSIVLFFSLNIISQAQNSSGLNAFYSRQQNSVSRINFKGELMMLPVYNWDPKIFDSLPMQSHIPLLRNENAGIWKKVGRAELFIGGAELFGTAVLMLSPKEVTGWSPDWIQDAWLNVKRSFLSHLFGMTMIGN